MYQIRTISLYRYAALAALLYGMMCTGCNKPSQPPSKNKIESKVPERLCPFPEDDPDQRLVQWAMGCEELRQSKPRKVAAAAIYYGNSKQPGICIQASTLLPAPDGEKVFAAGDDKLFVVDLPKGKPVPVSGATPAGWRFTRLLAFERGASEPLAILAEMVREQGGQQEYGLWRIEVRDTQATATPLDPKEHPRATPAFFGRYLVPRCERDHQRCIVPVDQGSNAGKARIEIRRGTTTEKTIERPPGTDTIIDAAWVPGSQDQMLLLVAAANC